MIKKKTSMAIASGLLALAAWSGTASAIIEKRGPFELPEGGSIGVKCFPFRTIPRYTITDENNNIIRRDLTGQTVMSFDGLPPGTYYVSCWANTFEEMFFDARITYP